MTITVERAETSTSGPIIGDAATAGSAVATAATPQYAKRRMYRIFAPDGKALVVAMDGARNGPAKGLHDPVKAVSQVVAGGADAILTTFGMARATQHALRGRGLIIGLDGTGQPADREDDVAGLGIAGYGVEHALRLGADAVELKVFPGNPERTRLPELRQLAYKCEQWGMPLLAEPIPMSFQDTSAHTLENVAKAARIGAESGGDFVKVHYVGPVEHFAERVIEESYVPVLCLGGPAKDDPVEALRACHDAMRAGAKGIVFGRNIVTAARPDKMCAALGEVIHGGASVEAAAKRLNPQF
jgi:class I fructose-bisphosphate aldolase/fructose-bisphosphate aldolase/2-amino-3,7-dideoxy-D-threo-hept-6-ulosonate synthase